MEIRIPPRIQIKLKFVGIARLQLDHARANVHSRLISTQYQADIKRWLVCQDISALMTPSSPESDLPMCRVGEHGVSRFLYVVRGRNIEIFFLSRFLQDDYQNLEIGELVSTVH